jgi:hypothetical protein
MKLNVTHSHWVAPKPQQDASAFDRHQLGPSTALPRHTPLNLKSGPSTSASTLSNNFTISFKLAEL